MMEVLNNDKIKIEVQKDRPAEKKNKCPTIPLY